ncbi:hypothetical protein AB0D10_35730 [Kitasatospora sp. NPDC048545]|uniref:hypothetical protein n=1 Tax=Kitasatospora sp. NPDC048545 TaxID=3157208 RepID=UPI0033D687E2
MSRVVRGARESGKLAASIRQLFDRGGEGVAFDGLDLVDVGGQVRRFQHRGRDLVAKLRPLEAARSERALAAEAAHRLGRLVVDGFGTVKVCVPELVPLPGRRAALVSPYLGTRLSVEDDGARALSVPVIAGLLVALLDRGVEASGCVPRNMFRRSGETVLIDWEDALLVPAGAAPDGLTLMKWDIAWSDLLGRDLKLRERIPVSAPDREVELDGFEAVLAGWLTPAMTRRDVRGYGIRLTLASELPLGIGRSASAASLGHLAEDVLPAGLGVFHSVLTARLREQRGEDAYAFLLGRLDALVSGQKSATPSLELEGLRQAWMLALFSAAETHLIPVPGPPLEQLAARFDRLAFTSGWAAACERAAAAVEITSRLAAVILAVLRLDEELDLLLRGSCAQGVVSRGSDVDFELSSATYPDGHRPVEDLLIEALACLGLAAEGSAARPAERDLVSADNRASRDLHEWLELRRPGSELQDPGWATDLLPQPSAGTVARPSQYEQQGRESTAKYLWFESRAALARLAFTASDVYRMPVTLEGQLAVIPQVLDAEDATELRDLVHATFALRERSGLARPGEDQHMGEIARLADRLDRFRQRVGLPGPRDL